MSASSLPVSSVVSAPEGLRPLIQNAVVRPAIAEVQTNRELVSFENHVSIYPNSARLFHSRSPFLCLEHVEHWERIASRGDRPSHPICPLGPLRPAKSHENHLG